MYNEYCDPQWWVNQIETRCKNTQKASERYVKSDRRFKKLLFLSFIFVAFGIVTGIFADLYMVNLIKSMGESLETLLMFIAGILAGFTIDEYRNRSMILENACRLRPLIFKKMINEMVQKGILQQSKVQICLSHIQNGAAQMSQSGDEGLSALKDVINNVIKEICT